MGNTMRNDAGFSAPGASQDEKGAFRMFHRLTLAGVQACEKIHEYIILARQIMLSF
jgi:hypothetical protein